MNDARSLPRVARSALLVAALLVGALVPAPAVGLDLLPVTGKYVPLAAQRVLDTRGPGPILPAPAVGATVELQVAGAGGVPLTGVTAVTLNLTVTGARQAGYVQVMPSGIGIPGSSSNVNVYTGGQTVSNLVTVPVGSGGRISFYDVAGAHLIADVTGYFEEASASAEGRFQPLGPTRVVDSRDLTGLPLLSPPPGPLPPANPGDVVNCGSFSTWAAANAWFWTYYPHYGDVAGLDDGDLYPCESLPGAPGHAVRPPASPPAPEFDPYRKPAAGDALRVRLAGAGGVPSTGASAVALTVTATGSSGAGYVQVVPSGGATPLGATSNVNPTAPGETVANLVIVPLGADGSVLLHTSSGTHWVVDVVGYFTDTTAAEDSTGLFVPVNPGRLTDTRPGAAAPGSQTTVSPLGRAGVPTTDVSALFLNATATETAGPGYLQVFPTGRAAPGGSSNVNYTGAGQTVATASIGTLGDAGRLTVFTPTRTAIVLDVFGYFTGSSTVAGPLLADLVVAPTNTTVAYDRQSWQHWTDDDGDCQDTRDEVLLAEALTTATLDAHGCDVVSGTWTDPYTGLPWTQPSDLDIDHLVALENAHDSGGWAWTAERKRAYANHLADPAHLVAVEDALNQAKGAAGPESWRPPSEEYWCTYATDWASVKRTWSLTVTQEELEALTAMVATC